MGWRLGEEEEEEEGNTSPELNHQEMRVDCTLSTLHRRCLRLGGVCCRTVPAQGWPAPVTEQQMLRNPQ